MGFAAELLDIGKAFAGLDLPVLHNLSLQVPEHAVTAIVGRNGSGKTTLLRITALLERADRGRLRVLGEDATDARDGLRGRVALLFQHPVVFDRSVYENIALPLRLKHFAESEVKARVSHYATQVGVLDLLSRNAKSLSGGQKQRVVLARTLAAGPELLLLDEPNNSLDREGLAALAHIVSTLKRRATVIVSTPDTAYAYSVADFIAFLEDGSVRSFGPKEHLKPDLPLTIPSLPLTPAGI